MERVQKVYFSDASSAPLPRHFMLQVLGFRLIKGNIIVSADFRITE
jgi:hypothetical protein